MLAGVTLSAAASFAVSSVLLKIGKQNTDSDGLEKAAEKTADLKGSKLKVDVVQSRSVKKIVFACDAGMGSSAMGASILRTKVKKAGLDIVVTNSSIGEIPGDADVVFTHETLTERARQSAPKARHISITDFIKSPEYDVLVAQLTA
jgi:PTS system mannitol-specific IIC component